MTSVIITCGFQALTYDLFRQKSLNKGKKLVESYHVSAVKEIKETNFSKIFGQVLRETPGSHGSQTNNVYSPVIEVDLNRRVIETNCNCKGGNGYCKHAAAVCIYVNLENTCSKTDQPMIWNRPPKVQLEKYHKGSKIEDLFPHAKGNRETQHYTFENVTNISSAILAENSTQRIIIEKELQCQAEKEVRSKENGEKQKELEIFLKELYRRQNKCTNQFSIMMSELQGGVIKFTIKSDHKQNKYYCDSIVVNEDEWLQISLKSAGQSESTTWFKERFIRITASSRAHRIKTREENFEDLAKSFIKEKYQSYLSIPALRYGLETEKEAKQLFQIASNFIIQNVGLIISSKQPYLACSPDGIIINENGNELLEIKCPYVCKSCPIVDMEREKIIAVSYLEFKNKKLQLKKNDKYYTQVQVSLYILSLTICHFYVYSPFDKYDILIQRDDEFLSSLIPKIEAFYFGWFLPLVQSEI